MDSEEPLEEDDDGNMELNPVFEKESYDEKDSSSTTNNKEEGDNSINSNELGDIIINATPQFITCNEPEIYSELDVQNAISCGDFARVVQIKTQVNLTDHQKFCLLQKRFVPSFNYKFPTHLLSNIP